MIQCQDLCLKHPHVTLQLQKGNPGANNLPEVLEALPKEETEEQGRLPTEDYMSHIIEKW